MKAAYIVLGVLAGVGLVAVGTLAAAVGTYNSLVNEREAIEAQSHQVDVQYQRAFRLVPQLINLTEQYMQNERDVITNATALRSGLAPAGNGTFEAKDAYLNQLVSFVALVGNRAENYPNLKANQLFQQTMDEIVNTENKIAAEKVRYNDRVQAYDAHLRRCCLPALLAGPFGFTAKPYIGYRDRPVEADFPPGQPL